MIAGNGSDIDNQLPTTLCFSFISDGVKESGYNGVIALLGKLRYPYVYIQTSAVHPLMYTFHGPLIGMHIA